MAAAPPDQIAAQVRARNWDDVPASLRGWAINDEIAMVTVDSNAVAIAHGAVQLGALDGQVQPGMFGSVTSACYNPSGNQLANSIRWACTFHNELERQRVAKMQGQAPPPSNGSVPRHLVRLRMARPTRADMAIVMDMIRGLAVFEKEPDAVVTNEDTMLRDGFGPGRQFQVIIAEIPAEVDSALKQVHAAAEAQAHAAAAGEMAGAGAQAALPQFPVPAALPDPSAGVSVPGWVPIAFAFSHGAYSTWEGRVLYLEDLYVQPYARRAGLSSILISTVARAAHVAQCARVQWSALDWNQAAINAYVHPRIGAQPLSEWTLFRLWRADIERVSGLKVAFNAQPVPASA